MAPGLRCRSGPILNCGFPTCYIYLVRHIVSPMARGFKTDPESGRLHQAPGVHHSGPSFLGRQREPPDPPHPDSAGSTQQPREPVPTFCSRSRVATVSLEPKPVPVASPGCAPPPLWSQVRLFSSSSPTQSCLLVPASPHPAFPALFPSSPCC